MILRAKSHWQPKMEKSYLLDDLNDWLADAGKIEANTKMTTKEIEIFLEAFAQMGRKQKP